MKLSLNPGRDKGWVRIASYRYAVPLKNGQWTVYEGEWSGTGDGIAGLTVVRDFPNNKPVRFNTLDEAVKGWGQ